MSEPGPLSAEEITQKTPLLWRSGRIAGFGPFVIATSRDGSMGYSNRWRWLSPISCRFKIVLRSCDFCGHKIGRASFCKKCGL